MKRLQYLSFAICAAALLAGGCSSQKKAESPEQAREMSEAETATKPEAPAAVKPKRIILLIGDGMGVPEITAASYAKGEPLSFLGMEQMGLITTHSYEFVTTDSAASATAFATGHKTHYEGVSVKPGTTKANEDKPSQHLKTLVEKAEEAGLRTGLVATSRIVHATPAAFAAHRANRHSYEDIAADMYASGVDVLLGGGPRFFNKRADGKDLLAGFKKKGYKIALDKAQIDQASKLSGKVIGLPHDPDFPPAGDPARKMTLAEMTDDALTALDHDNDKGFFLMVEGSQIDWRGHDLDGSGSVAETLDFDQAVRHALDYASGRDDTLVIVAADHETGGMAVLDPQYADPMEQALGGERKVDDMCDWPDGVSAEDPPDPVAEVALGRNGDDKTFGPAYAKDKRFDTVFGHLSVASRARCQSPDEFAGLHTPSFIPIFAQGKASDFVAAADDNAELGRRIATLIGPESINAARPRSPGGDHLQEQKPQNVIVMVGDGMGIGALTAAYYGHGKLAMRDLPIKGLAATHAADRLVTDSAAGGSALATGRRTNVGSLGMARTDKGLVAAKTLVERAEARGMATGIVTTTTLTHATPAAFYAHYPDRSDESAIAQFFVDLPERVSGSDGVDVAFGAGPQIFGQERLDALRERGVVVETKWSDTVPKDKQIMRLMGEKGLKTASVRDGDDDPKTPSLAQMTRAALQRLSQDKDGFVLVVEGGQIDWAEHGMVRDQRLIDEVVDFDQAVGAAYDFARTDGNTLMVVTADHDHTTSVIDDHYQFDGCSCAAAVECGGSYELTKIPAAVDKVEHNEGLTDTALQGKYSPLEISIQYAWLAQEGAPKAQMNGPHSANFVPVFAYGPQAAKLRGFHELPDIGQVLAEAVTR